MRAVFLLAILAMPMAPLAVAQRGRRLLLPFQEGATCNPETDEYGEPVPPQAYFHVQRFYCWFCRRPSTPTWPYIPCPGHLGFTDPTRFKTRYGHRWCKGKCGKKWAY
jgi:hypothetical protein